MPMFDFSDMLAAYSVSLTIYKPQDGSLQGWDPNTGDPLPVPKAPQLEMSGALIPYKQNEIYHSGGRLTQYDRQLLIDDTDIPMKSIVLSNGQKYSVEAMIPYSDYADFNQYELKWVSAFDNESNI